MYKRNIEALRRVVCLQERAMSESYDELERFCIDRNELTYDRLNYLVNVLAEPFF